MQSFLKSHFLGQTLLYSSSTLFFQLARFATFLVAAKLLGPETYGLWMALWLVIAYGINAHLGVLNGLNREVPFARGRRRPELAVAIRGVSLSVAVGRDRKSVV